MAMMKKKAMVKKTMVKKAEDGVQKKKPTPTYKNLKMGVKNERYLMSGVSSDDVNPSKSDSNRYLGGYMQGIKGMKGGPNEGQVEKAGRWEGQNANKPKKKGKIGMKLKKAQTGITEKGVLSKIPEAGAMKKTKSKERSADGNYMVKTVTRETPEGKRSSTKTRRTVQGILRGAPSVQKYKTGGMKKTSKKK